VSANLLRGSRILNRAQKKLRAEQGPSPSILSLAGRGEEAASGNNREKKVG
jgi:hypothetical protein